MTCSATHPDNPLATCERNPGNHEFHSYYDFVSERFVDWPNEKYTKTALNKTQREGRTRKQLKDMISRVNKGESNDFVPTYLPTEGDMRGRTALYLQKYKGEWVTLEELEMKTVGGKGALRSIQELTHTFKWKITEKRDPEGNLTQVRLDADQH